MPESPCRDVMVVFDVDDTLYLERDYVRSGFAAVGGLVEQRFGIEGFAEVAWRCFLDGKRRTIFDTALTELGARFTTADVAELVGAYRRHPPQISLLPDAAAILSVLRGQDVSIGVLTDGPAQSQSAKVDALGLRDIAHGVVITDLYGPGFGKPHTRGFSELENLSGCANLVYVADNPFKDFAGPKRLGWGTVRIRRAGALHAAVADSDDIDHTIDDLGGLYRLVEPLTSGWKFESWRQK